jgi:hypothetical protein
MDELERNHRNLIVATIIMLLVTGALIALGVILFPLTAYDDPNAGVIRGLINTPQGNLLVISMFGVLAANIGVYLSTVTRLERERNSLLARNASTQAQTPESIGSARASGAIAPPNQTDSIFKPQK